MDYRQVALLSKPGLLLRQWDSVTRRWHNLQDLMALLQRRLVVLH